MWQFRKIRLKMDGFPSEWVLKIDTLEQLTEYIIKIRPKQIEDAFLDQININLGNPHHKDNLALTAHIRAGCSGESFVESLIGVVGDINTGMMKVILNGDILYIKHTGGYSSDTIYSDLYEVLEEKASEKLIWPKSGVVEIKQWPQGKHWYAKVDGVEVVINGISKWNSWGEANDAAIKWKKSNI